MTRLAMPSMLLLLLLLLGACGDEDCTTCVEDPQAPVLTGRVLGADGSPVPGARVTFVFGIDGIDLPGWEGSTSHSLDGRVARDQPARWILVQVFDYAGDLVRTLFDGEPPADLGWDGTDDSGLGVVPGLYTIRVTATPEVGSAEVSEARVLLYFESIDELFDRNQTSTDSDGWFSVALDLVPAGEQIEVRGWGEADGLHEVSSRVRVVVSRGDIAPEAWVDTYVDVGQRLRTVQVDLTMP